MEEKFYAKIYLKNLPNPTVVEVMARNTMEAQKKIEAMYGGNFKSWYIRPTTHRL